MTHLQGETGGTASERRAELQRLLHILEGEIDRMEPREQQFLTDMADSLAGDEWTPTPRQLFWARDLNEKY